MAVPKVVSPVERLVNECGAQNLATYMDALHSNGKMCRVAQWVEGMQLWEPTAAGLAMLEEKDAAAAAAAPEVKEEVKDPEPSKPQVRGKHGNDS